MNDWGVLYGVRILEKLTDWKSAREVAEELGLPEPEVKATLEALTRRGLVFRDGFRYIRQGGRA